MSTALERRMAKLEEAAHLDANEIEVIYHRIVSPDCNNEVIRAVIGDNVVDRRADEAEDAFMERAKAEALASTDRRPCIVILWPEEAMSV